MKASDTQIGGDHYQTMGDFQPWDVLAHWLTPEEYRGYQKGVAIAYLARERQKGGDQDIRKALHHLQRLVEEFDKAGDRAAQQIADTHPAVQAVAPKQSRSVLDGLDLPVGRNFVLTPAAEEQAQNHAIAARCTHCRRPADAACDTCGLETP